MGINESLADTHSVIDNKLYMKNGNKRKMCHCGKTFNLDAVVLDSPDVRLLTEFYAKLLNWKIDFINEATCGRVSSPDGGCRLLIQLNEIYERPVWPEQKSFQQQQEHLDFEVSSQEEMQSAVKHALNCGATLAEAQFGYNEEKQADDWVTLIDPVGHPFCFVIW